MQPMTHDEIMNKLYAMRQRFENSNSPRSRNTIDVVKRVQSAQDGPLYLEAPIVRSPSPKRQSVYLPGGGNTRPLYPDISNPQPLYPEINTMQDTFGRSQYSNLENVRLQLQEIEQKRRAAEAPQTPEPIPEQYESSRRLAMSRGVQLTTLENELEQARRNVYELQKQLDTMQKKLKLKTETVIELEEKASLLDEQLKEARQQLHDLKGGCGTNPTAQVGPISEDKEQMYKMLIDNLNSQIADQRAQNQFLFEQQNSGSNNGQLVALQNENQRLNNLLAEAQKQNTEYKLQEIQLKAQIEHLQTTQKSVLDSVDMSPMLLSEEGDSKKVKKQKKSKHSSGDVEKLPEQDTEEKPKKKKSKDTTEPEAEPEQKTKSKKREEEPVVKSDDETDKPKKKKHHKEGESEDLKKKKKSKDKSKDNAEIDSE